VAAGKARVGLEAMAAGSAPEQAVKRTVRMKINAKKRM
jgi:hypothetical protein